VIDLESGRVVWRRFRITHFSGCQQSYLGGAAGGLGKRGARTEAVQGVPDFVI